MENEIKNWYVLAKGITNTGSIPTYDYINKSFTGTHDEFYNTFLDQLENKYDAFKIIDCGEDKPIIKKEVVESKTINKFVEKKKDYSSSFEDSFNRVKKFKYIGQ